MKFSKTRPGFIPGHKTKDMESVKTYIRENWPLAVVTFVILSVGIALFEAGIL